MRKTYFAWVLASVCFSAISYPALAAPGLPPSWFETAGRTVSVTSFPDNVEVYLDGKATGKKTPTLISVPGGEHTIEGRVPGSTEWKPALQQINITGSTAKKSFVHLIMTPTVTTGPQGPEGPAGPAGPTGPQGLEGPKGETGATGAIGPIGPKGEAGPVGPAGPKGETGAIGPVGPKGETGAVGPVGPKGETGPIGLPGLTGPAGPVGPQGPIGATGPRGETGPAGEAGPVGPVGPQGEIGATGPRGETGPAGAAGPVGPIGPVGPKGEIGLTGPKGDTGAPGPKGDKGDAGAPGATGPAGPKGDTGAAGLPGEPGPQGVAGPIGPAGPTGPPGLAGPQGIPGPAGQTGSWSTPYTSSPIGNFKLNSSQESLPVYSFNYQVVRQDNHFNGEVSFQMENLSIEIPVNSMTVDLMDAFLHGQDLGDAALNIQQVPGKEAFYTTILNMQQVQIDSIKFLHGSMRNARYTISLKPLSIQHLFQYMPSYDRPPIKTGDFTLNFATRRLTVNSLVHPDPSSGFYIAEEGVSQVPPAFTRPLISAEFGMDASLDPGTGLPRVLLNSTPINTVMPNNDILPFCMCETVQEPTLSNLVISTIGPGVKGPAERFKHTLINPYPTSFQLTFDQGMDSLVLDLNWGGQQLKWEDPISKRSATADMTTF